MIMKIIRILCVTVVIASSEDPQSTHDADVQSVLEDNAFDICPSNSLTLDSPNALNYLVFLHEAVAFTGLPNYKCRRFSIFTHLHLDA